MRVSVCNPVSRDRARSSALTRIGAACLLELLERDLAVALRRRPGRRARCLQLAALLQREEASPRTPVDRRTSLPRRELQRRRVLDDELAAAMRDRDAARDLADRGVPPRVGQLDARHIADRQRLPDASRP